MRKIFSAFLGMLLLSFGQCVWAEEKVKSSSELDELKKRIEDIEMRLDETDVIDERGHKLHPIHSIYGLKIGGGLTITAQGVMHHKNTNQKGAGAISADIAMESSVGNNGRAVVVFDFERGAGLQNLPTFFTSPNGNASGPNGDVESFNNDQLHVTQFYYEHDVYSNLILTLGQLDITGYFDANEFADNERTQFLANLFIHNPSVEFGGSADFFSPGIRLTYSPLEYMDITIGAFEGNGDYVDMFDKPFVMGEVGFKLKPFGKEGNYRLYYWNRQGRDSLTNTANPTDNALLEAQNKGIGLNIDQYITDTVGIWLMGGVQRKKVAQFDRFIGGGLNITGEAFSRPNDVIGLGYGVTLMGKDYKDYKKSSSPDFEPEAEHYMELYYNWAVADAPQSKGFHISPDIQYVMNPGGDPNATKLFIYGIRFQTFF